LVKDELEISWKIEKGTEFLGLVKVSGLIFVPAGTRERNLEKKK
jgi:hypothetical protein